MNKQTIITILLALVAMAGRAQNTVSTLADTYWRNEKTGDWLIGITANHVIYDNMVWDIVARTEKKDTYTLTISRPTSDRLQSKNGTTIRVGRQKKGLRSIAVGKQKPITCSLITTETLPDYPTKDTRVGFVDNGYQMGDSVTIVGWLKDMPEQAMEKGKEFAVAFENIITNEQETAYAKMDSLGRFSFKMSLFNTSEVFIDWGRSTVNAFLEPGKTYFFLYDFKTGQKLWMGDDVRVQNEILAHPRSRSHANVPYDKDDVDLYAYWAQADSARLLQEKHLNMLQMSHPTLSQRYVDYVANYYRMEQGRNMMQARFHAKDRIVPQEYMDYVGREFWKQVPKPYTLYRDFTTMNNDFLQQVITNRGNTDISDVFKRFEKEGKLVMTDEEKNALDKYSVEIQQVQADIKAAKTDEERQRIAETFNTSETVTAITAMVDRNQDLLSTYSFQQVLDVVDSIGCDRHLRDIVLAQRFYMQIDGFRKPLTPNELAFAEREILLPAALNPVKVLNDKYLEIQQRDISKSSSLKSSEDLANMSDGEKLLRKIIEPYRGRIILLDIWGTWCGPCKEALSHSQEEYERLKDYNLVYLYLCNRSSDESWKNVIKEYDLVGDNIVHYNLPQDQQSAIEHFVQVDGFPTYKLIDKEGNILDVNADPRNLEALARVLEQMK